MVLMDLLFIFNSISVNNPPLGARQPTFM
jgi:hypothetical protein